MSDNATDAESPSSAHRRRHSSRSGSGNNSMTRRSSQRMMLAIALAITLIALITVTTFFSLQVMQLNKLNDSLNAELDEKKMELSNIKPRLEQVQQELQQIVKGRIPQLREMQADKVIPVDRGYLKNIVFTVTKSNQQKQYEYKLVLENTSNTKIYPNARVVLFNRLGIQIGMDEINEKKELSPGESRSHSASFSLSVDDEPRYFIVGGKTPL